MSHNSDLLARHQAAIPRGVASAFAIYARRAENGIVWDVDGKRYVDFASGIAVLNTGHRHPAVMTAAIAQMEAFTHTAFQVLPYENYIALAERLNALAPFKGTAKTVLFTTGAEAVENAVKVARAATDRSGIIAFAGGFHGRTLMASALTGKVAPYKRMFGTMPGEVYHLPFPVAHQHVSVQDTIRALDMLFKTQVDPSRIAAFIIEPVQGEGGFYAAPPELLRTLRAICDTHGILLIADEIQSGFGRTGKMFAIEHSGVQPDLVTIAKSLAGGFPLSGLIGRARVMDAVEPGGLGGTYGGNPVACAAALAVLDVIEKEKLMARANVIGERTTEALVKISARNDIVPIGTIRSVGAMVAFEAFTARDGFVPDPAAAKEIVRKAADMGLILLTCGNMGNVIRILMPLTIPDAILEEGLALMDRALTL